jgi:transcriptional regulator with XRE-family HTH domain
MGEGEGSSPLETSLPRQGGPQVKEDHGERAADEVSGCPRGEEFQALRRALGARIAKLRAMRGLSQSELGDRLGIPPSRLSRIETGQREPQIRELLELRQVFGVSLDCLVAGSVPSKALEDVRLRELLGRIESVAPPEVRDAVVEVLRSMLDGLRVRERRDKEREVQRRRQ